MSKIKLLGLLAAPLLALVSTGMASADTVTPQSWTTKCAWDQNSDYWLISLPGKTDLDVDAIPCVHRSGSSVYASVQFDWSNDQLPPVGSGHKFDGLKVRANLDVRPNGGTDTIFEHKDCDITAAVNASWSGTVTCSTPTYTGYSSSFDYSGDGWVNVDVDNDGKSWLPARQLYGSPYIY